MSPALLAALLQAALAASPTAPAAPELRFAAANRAYLAGDFEGAARGYQDLLADGWESAALHLNLGNARHRLGKRGAAIAAYARALRLDPGDADARANLELLRAANTDPPSRAHPLALRAAERVPDALAVIAFALAWLGLWAALAARGLAAPARRRLLGLLAGAAALLAVAGGAVLAAKAAARATTLAVVTAPVTPAREGPETALQPSFELHEGTEVQVLEVRGAAARVRVGDRGLEGWVAAVDLESI